LWCSARPLQTGVVKDQNSFGMARNASSI